MHCQPVPRRAGLRTVARYNWYGERHVAEQERNYLMQCLKRGVCPVCRQLTVTKYGTGRFEDGVFCSFECSVKWREGELIRKHQESQSRGKR